MWGNWANTTNQIKREACNVWLGRMNIIKIVVTQHCLKDMRVAADPARYVRQTPISRRVLLGPFLQKIWPVAIKTWLGIRLCCNFICSSDLGWRIWQSFLLPVCAHKATTSVVFSIILCGDTHCSHQIHLKDRENPVISLHQLLLLLFGVLPLCLLVAWAAFHYYLVMLIINASCYSDCDLVTQNCIYYWGSAAFVSYFVNHPQYTPPSE